MAEKQSEPEKPMEPPKPEQPKDIAIDESTGRVKFLNQPESKYAGKDVSDVAMELMREAPKTAYTQPAILKGLDDDDDDALKRVRMLKQSGKFQQLEDNVDKHLEELN